MRRLVFALWMAFSLCPTLGAAHDGAHDIVALAMVTQAERRGADVMVELVVTSVIPGMSPQVTGFIVDDGAPITLVPAVTAPFAEDVTLNVPITFDGPPPESFLLIVLFGEAGHGGVYITPTDSTAQAQTEER